MAHVRAYEGMSGSYVLFAGRLTPSRRRAVATLRSAGYQVVEAERGPEAVAYTTALQPALVIVDVSIAGEDARDFADAQRACDALQSTPTLVIGSPAATTPEGPLSADKVLESSDHDMQLLAAVRQFCLPALTR